ncbi:MAG TPA: VacB/RNase II family 3'-5' exoribonuclease [Bryobacteraceae bacterium]
MPAVSLDESAVLAHIAKLPHARATFKQLVKELRANGRDRETLEDVLDHLTARGDLVETKSGHFVLTKMSREFAVGPLRVHKDGYAFINDIYIPRESAEQAMHGDLVVVHIRRMDANGRGDGEIVKVLKRAHPAVVGEFRVGRHGCFVIPFDQKLTAWIDIVEGMEIPRDEGENVDRVGVEAVEVKTVEELDHMIVNVEILEFPERGDHATGRVIEILGHADDFGIDVEIIIRKHHLPHRFPQKVIDEARAISKEIPEGELARRRDFRALEIVTIDGETARDFDDAVWVEHLENGNFALQVHIADVSYYVTPGSPIDREAFERGTSVYFPDRAVPMLPVELSTDICSLRPQEDRLVLSALLEIDPRGEVVGTDFCRGIIRSAERMTYTNVHKILEGDAEQRERYKPLVARFELMRDLAAILNKKRVRRGSIDFDLPEPLIEFDSEGEMAGVTRAPRNNANRLIEEFMLAANEAVAAHVESLELPMMFRIHEQPDPKRVMEFEEVAVHFGYSLGLGAVPVKRYPMMVRGRDGKKRRHEVTLADPEISISSRNYQKLIAKIEGKPEERILSYLMLRSLKQAKYSAENKGHFALAAKSYTHFTSPIRRYPDLMVHRILTRVFDELPAKWPTIELAKIADSCSDTERRAADAERELVEWKKSKFMIDRVGEEFHGLVTNTTRFGFFVELADLFIEGLVPMDTLTGDRFVYQENRRKIVGERTRREISIGDQVEVRLDRVDAVDRKLQFSLVESAPERRRDRKFKKR